MKFISLFLSVVCCTTTTFAQKPVIDSLAITRWTEISPHSTFSSDGNYFMYTIENQPTDSRTLIIQRINNSWKKIVTGASLGSFTEDGKKAIVQCNDTLVFFC